MNNQLTSTTNHPEKPHIITNLLIRNALLLMFAGGLSGAIYAIGIALLSSMPGNTLYQNNILFQCFIAIVGGLIGGALGLTAGFLTSLITIPLTLTLY